MVPVISSPKLLEELNLMADRTSSQPGEGPPAQDQESSAASQVNATAEAIASDGSKLRILVVDDDETVRDTMTSFLARPDFETVVATNGLEGIAKAQAGQPDLIFLDLMMPVMGGHEVLQQLKSDAATASIPVVVVTSRLLNEDERAQILTRAAMLLPKSDLSKERLAETIRETVGR
jgi:CheY-like chemotaxis protein